MLHLYAARQERDNWALHTVMKKWFLLGRVWDASCRLWRRRSAAALGAACYPQAATGRGAPSSEASHGRKSITSEFESALLVHFAATIGLPIGTFSIAAISL
jgi:hypothetical protein